MGPDGTHPYMGDRASHVEFKVDGTVLTGTVEDAANGAVVPIKNGKYENGESSYQLTIKTAASEVTNHLAGRVEGEKLVEKSKKRHGRI